MQSTQPTSIWSVIRPVILSWRFICFGLFVLVQSIAMHFPEKTMCDDKGNCLPATEGFPILFLLTLCFFYVVSDGHFTKGKAFVFGVWVGKLMFFESPASIDTAAEKFFGEPFEAILIFGTASFLWFIWPILAWIGNKINQRFSSV